MPAELSTYRRRQVLYSSFFTPKPRDLVILLAILGHPAFPRRWIFHAQPDLCPQSCRLVVAVHFLFKFLQQHRVLWLLFPCFCQRQPERVILGEDAIIDLSVRRTAASLALPGQHPTETSTSTDSSKWCAAPTMFWD